jgi:hypothetical protein
MRRMMMPLRYVSSLAAPMRSHGEITPNRAPPASHARNDLEAFGSAFWAMPTIASSGRARDCCLPAIGTFGRVDNGGWAP